MSENLNNISIKVKTAGVTSVKNFLNDKNLDLANEAIAPVLNNGVTKGDYKGVYPVSLKNYLIKFAKLQFSQIKRGQILKKIAKDLKLKEIAEDIFDQKAELHMIDSYFNAKSNKNVIDWHCDMAHGGLVQPKDLNLNKASIKFFFYMSDVKSENGCLGYIPYSQHIVKALANLIKANKIEYKPYWKLEDLRQTISKENNKQLIKDIVGEEILNNFLNSSEFIEDKRKDTFKFDLEMNKDGMVVFDEFGVHRGSMPSKSSRLVLRFFYRRSKI